MPTPAEVILKNQFAVSALGGVLANKHIITRIEAHISTHAASHSGGGSPAHDLTFEEFIAQFVYDVAEQMLIEEAIRNA